ncbi:fibrocystin-L-like [Branchiostoma floridae]|uniref:Fibrocystin-L-like n=1 Tax=Branchiostoma floridae TaxID=7739 RepID=A0A9J7L927_BRAFL|nr:fibrocystin-L-like [Branchiostoma floridae]
MGSVSFSGVICDVLSVSPVEITCRTRAKPPGTRRKQLYPGNRGLLYEIWTKTFTSDVRDVTKLPSTSGDYKSFFAPEAANPPKAVTGEWNRYSFRLSGFFVPPVTAEYTFWIYSDDQSVLSLSDSDRKENKVEIAECPSYTSSYFTNRSQKSVKLPLAAGERYYMVSVAHDYGGPDYTIAIQIPDESNGPEEFSLLWDGVRSKPIPTAATALQIQEAVEAMLTVQCVQPVPSDVLFHRDYETVHGTVWGTLSRDTEPYCGRASLRLPAYLFGHGRVKMREDSEAIPMFDVDDYPIVCLAYKGHVARSLAVQLRYHNKFVDDIRTAWRHYQIFPEATEDEKWQYTCADLRNLTQDDQFFNDRKKQGTRLHVLWIHIGVISGRPAYVDEFFIAASPVSGAIPLLAVADMTATAGDVTAESNVVMYSDAVEGPTWVIMVVRRSRATPEVGGYFSIGYNESYVTVSAQVSAHDLQTLLLDKYPELRGYGLHVDKHGDCVSPEWTLTFTGGPCDSPDFQVFNVSLNGDDPQVINYIIDGGVILSPIPGDMLATPHMEPQVTVTVNDIPSTCYHGDCTFYYTTVSMPTATTVNPSSGSAGKTIEVTGSGFPNELGAINVTVGDVTCDVVSVTSTSVRCTVGLMTSGGVHHVVVYVHPHGYAINLQGPLTFTYSVNLTGIQPIRGSTAGGTLLTLHGDGINNATVWIGKELCTSVEEDNSGSGTIQCTTPAIVDNVNTVANVTVEVGGASAMLEGAFTYGPSITPVVTVSMPTNVSVSGGDILQLEGFLFGNNDSLISVTIGSNICEITDLVTDNNISCILPPQPQGRYPVLLYVDGVGYAYSRNPLEIEYVFRVDTISPIEGSLAGGTELRINGEGFPTNISATEVKIGPVLCDIQEISETTLLCVTRPYVRRYRVINVVSGSVLAWEPEVLECKTGDVVEWQWSTLEGVVDLSNGVHRISVTNANDTVVLEDSFSSDKGPVTFKFINPGVYNYESQFMGSQQDIIINGTVIVTDRTEEIEKIALAFSGIFADNKTDILSYTFSDSHTPVVTKITPLVGAAGTEVVLEGKHFSNTVSGNRVHIGHYNCNVTTVSESKIVCTVNDQETLPTGATLPVSLKVANYGNAVILEENAMFLVVPVIMSPAPSSGSVAGGTRISIFGCGFHRAGYETKVVIGEELQCEIIELSYTNVVCKTDSSTIGTTNTSYQVSVVVGNAESMCLTNCDFQYSSDNIPVIDDLRVDTFWMDLATIDTVWNTTENGNFNYTTAVTHMSSAAQNVTLMDPSNGTFAEASTETPETTPDTTHGNSSVNAAYTSLFTRPYNESDTTPVNTAGTTPDSNVTLGTSVRNTSSTTTGPISIHPMSTEDGPISEVTVTAFTETTDEVYFTEVASTEAEMNTSTNTVLDGNLTTGSATTVTTDALVVDNFTTGAGNVNSPMSPTNMETQPVTRAATTILPTTSPYSPENMSILGLTTVSSSITMATMRNNTEEEPPYWRTEVTVVGSNFPDDMTSVNITVGDHPCNIRSFNKHVVICWIINATAGHHVVAFNVDQRGFAIFNTTNVVTISPIVTDIAPSQGSVAGGTEIAVTGQGFDVQGNTTVTIGKKPCSFLSVDFAEIRCTTPPGSGETEGFVTVNNVDSESFTFLYDQDRTPFIHSVYPRIGVSGENLTIFGENFSNRTSGVHVLVGGQKCADVVSNDTVITCTTGVRFAGVYPVQVSVTGLGDALSNATFEVQLQVTGVSETEGSFGGHQLIVISGSGFHPNNTSIILCGEPCAVVNISRDQLSCLTPSRCNGKHYSF